MEGWNFETEFECYLCGPVSARCRLCRSPCEVPSMVSSDCMLEISMTPASTSSSADRPSGLNLSRSNGIRSASPSFDKSDTSETRCVESRPRSRPSRKATMTTPTKFNVGIEMDEFHRNSTKVDSRSKTCPTITCRTWNRSLTFSPDGYLLITPAARSSHRGGAERIAATCQVARFGKARRWAGNSLRMVGIRETA